MKIVPCSFCAANAINTIIQSLVKLQNVTQQVGEWNTNTAFTAKSVIIKIDTNFTNGHALIVHTGNGTDPTTKTYVSKAIGCSIGVVHNNCGMVFL